MKCGASCHLDVIVRYSFATKEIHDGIFFIASFLVSSSHETFVVENRWFGGGGYHRINRSLMQDGRTHTSIFIRSIQVCECAFALHQEQKRDHFGAVAIDAHRMFHRDSTALETPASGLGWTSAGLPHIQGVHGNLRTNPVDPSSPLQKLTHTTTTTLFVACVLNSTDV